MDPITHGVAGALLAKMGPEAKIGRPAVPLMVTAALLPDLDHLTWLWGHLAYLEYHRGFSHSVPGAVVLACLLAWAVRPWVRAPAFGWLLGAGFLGILSHIGLDVVTAYGTQVWYPFTRTRYALDLAFILDPFLTATLLLPLILGFAVRSRAVALARTGGALLAAYLLMAAVNHDRAIAVMWGALKAQGLTTGEIAALPQPFSPFGWMTIATTPDRYYVARFHLLEASRLPQDMPQDMEVVAYPRGQDNPQAARVAAQARASRDVQVYEWFARFPVIRRVARDDGQILEYADLRFSPPSAQPRFGGYWPVHLRVILDSSGRVLESSIR